jgi:hypothetical protein
MAPMLINPDRQGFVIVETELDGFMLDRFAGDMVGILALGSVAVRPDRLAHAAMANSLCILNSLDYDAAGAKAIAWWVQNYKQHRRWPVPVGKDPGDAFAAGVDLREWLITGLPPAWRIGRSSCLDNKGGADVLPAAPEKVADATQFVASATPDVASYDEAICRDLPESVRRLYDLLKQYPVAILCSGYRLAVVPKEGFDNFAVMAEFSRLVFSDDDVFDYLHALPEGKITAGNFLQRGE